MMRSAHWCALAAGLAVLAAGAVKWYGSQSGNPPALPADLTRREVIPVAPELKAASPKPRPTPAPRPFEPIVVRAEPFTDPAPMPASVIPGGVAEESDHSPVRPNPRPEAFVLRMPYADEELSEFALLLQRAAQERRQAPPLAPSDSPKNQPSSKPKRD
jgi:hypothetical protein